MSCEPGPPALEAELVARVHDSLRLYLHDNARFMCERLVAEFPSPVRSDCLERPWSPRPQRWAWKSEHAWMARPADVSPAAR